MFVKNGIDKKDRRKVEGSLNPTGRPLMSEEDKRDYKIFSYLPKKLNDKLVDYAIYTNLSKSNIIAMALIEFFKKNKMDKE